MCCLTGESEQAQSQSVALLCVWVCVPQCASLLPVILWTSHLRLTESEQIPGWLEIQSVCFVFLMVRERRPHRSCLHQSKVCLFLHVFLIIFLYFFYVNCSCQKNMFTSEMCISVLKAIFFHKAILSDQEWMKPVIFDECLFRWMCHITIYSFALSLSFFCLFLFMNYICTVKHKITHIV